MTMEQTTAGLGFEPLLNTKEVSSILRVTTRTIRKLTSEGSLPYIKVGSNIRFKKNDVQEWIDARYNS